MISISPPSCSYTCAVITSERNFVAIFSSSQYIACSRGGKLDIFAISYGAISSFSTRCKTSQCQIICSRSGIRYRTFTVNVKTSQIQRIRVNFLQINSNRFAIVRADLNFHRAIFRQHVHAVELGLTRYAVNFVKTGFDFVLDGVQVRGGVSSGRRLNRQFTNTL
ncbi:hypothetical protein BvCmsSIP076_01801 [Escherichia coli]|nr:hypothetical protein BvCmsSIP076_01801 [Escherichia coli]